jgi:Flp pilus assembly protein CpaB
MKKVMPIVVALLLAALASYGILSYTRQLSTTGQSKEFVAAKENLQPGHVLSVGDLVTGRVAYPASTRNSAAVWSFVLNDFVDPGNLNSLVNRTVNREIPAGFPILVTSLKSEERVTHRMDWKSAKISDGKRAIAIPVNEAQAVNGLVEVGDHVDVLVTVTVPTRDGEGETEMMTVPMRMGDTTQNVKIPTGRGKRGEPMTFYLLQDVEILSVGSKTFRVEEVDMEDPLQAMAAGRGGGRGVTVALSPDQALLLSFVIASGDSEFTLALRTPGDQSLYDTTNKAPASFKELMLLLGVQR